MIDEVLRGLEKVRRAGEGWVARCPAHDDAQASLSVRDKGGDEYPLLHCFTGCSFDDIRAALEVKGVKQERRQREESRGERTLRERTPYDIKSPGGELLCRHVRLEWSDNSKTFAWEMPDGERRLRGIKAEDMLFGAEVVHELDMERLVIVTEGEKAADALRTWGVKGACATVCGASGTPTDIALEVLRGRRVYLWPDADDVGRRHMERVAATLRGITSRVKVIEWAEAPPKGDAADWVHGKAKEDLQRLLDGAAAPGPTSATSSAVSGYPEGVVALGDPELVKATLRDMEAYSQGTRDVIPTGFPRLDRAIRGGFESGEVYLLGAPSGGGKTTAMLHFAEEAARKGPVLFVTPEMTLQSMVRRELIRRTGKREADVASWSRADVREQAWGEFAKAASALLSEGLPILLYDKADAIMDDIEDVLDQIPGVRMLLIDYAQQVADQDSRTPRHLQVGAVAQRSTVIAKRLNIPVILASQVNVIEGKGRQKRRVYSFRETQTLEHKAAVVLLFDVVAQDEQGDADDEPTAEAVFMCRKNRHGVRFRPIPVVWWKSLFRIEPPQEAPRQEALPEQVRQPYKGEDE